MYGVGSGSQAWLSDNVYINNKFKSQECSKILSDDSTESDSGSCEFDTLNSSLDSEGEDRQLKCSDSSNNSSGELSLELSDSHTPPLSVLSSPLSLPKSPYVRKRVSPESENDSFQLFHEVVPRSPKRTTTSRRNLELLFASSTRTTTSTTVPQAIDTTTSIAAPTSNSLTALPFQRCFTRFNQDQGSTLPRSSSLPLRKPSSLPAPELAPAGLFSRRGPIPDVLATPIKPVMRRMPYINDIVPLSLNMYQKYLSIIGSLEKGVLIYQKKEYKVAIIPEAKGQYKQAFTICPGQPEMISGYSNDKILIKAFHRRCVEKDFEKIDRLISQSLSQRCECIQNDIPFADILNIDPNAKTLIGGIFIVPMVPFAVDVMQWAIQKDGTDPLKTKKLTEFSELVSVKATFNRAIKKLINLDMNPDNFRYYDKEERKVILSDFREVVEEDNDDPFTELDTIDNLFNGLLEWANNRLEVWNFLTSDFTQKNTHLTIAKRIEKGRKKLVAVELYQSARASTSSSSSIHS